MTRRAGSGRNCGGCGSRPACPRRRWRSGPGSARTPSPRWSGAGAAGRVAGSLAARLADQLHRPPARAGRGGTPARPGQAADAARAGRHREDPAGDGRRGTPARRLLVRGARRLPGAGTGGAGGGRPGRPAPSWRSRWRRSGWPTVRSTRAAPGWRRRSGGRTVTCAPISCGRRPRSPSGGVTIRWPWRGCRRARISSARPATSAAWEGG